MGVIAALATQTNKIGVIGGADASEIKRGHEAVSSTHLCRRRTG